MIVDRRSPAAVPCLEHLERRRLLASALIVEGDVISVIGNHDRDDRIVITVRPRPDLAAIVDVEINGIVTTFGLDPIRKIAVYGRRGNDTILFRGDEALPSPFDVRIDGDDGDDTLTGGAGRTTINGGGGDDEMIAREGNRYYFTGGDGNDTITGTNRSDTVHAGAGDDRVFGRGGDDLISGDDGIDFLDGGSANDVLFGGEGDDSMRGGSGNDVLFGDDGHDALDGGAGHDWLFGMHGNDTLFGSDGHDLLYGGVGADRLLGGAGFNATRHGEFGGIDALHAAKFATVRFR